MKLCRLFVALVLVCAAASVAKADAVDPKVIIGGSGSCQSFSITSLTETFSGVKTGCLVDFTNNIGSEEEGTTLEKLVVNIASSFEGPLSCEIGKGAPFDTGKVSSPTSCTFSNTSEDDDGGIGFGQTFSLTFDKHFGSTVDIILAQRVISTPEPATLLLLTAGIGALCGLRKRRETA